MRWLSLAIASLCLTAVLSEPAMAKSITDSAGRRVEVPDRVTRVFTAGPPASTLLYVLAPHVMIGWMKPPTEQERPYLLSTVRNLPELGRLTGRGNTANLEVVVAAKPDLILDVGTINETYKSLADRIQEQTGVPYILLDGSFSKTAEIFRLLGDILGVSERADVLARASDQIFNEVESVISQVPLSKRPRAYLARGQAGLQSGTRGSINTEIIERAGAVNVVEGIAGRPGLVTVSQEQVIAWSPDTIVTIEATFRPFALRDEVWRNVPAVSASRVFVAPSVPFGWIDSPPAVNRLIGLSWLLHVLYPDQVRGDLPTRVRDFYHLFYQVDLNNDELARLLDAK